MCGICGYFRYGQNKDPKARPDIRAMRDVMTHRGPDDAGIFVSSQHDAALGHRRLSIIDLSSSGRQPMSNEDDTIWLTYNGEVYNFKTLTKKALSRGHRFKSKTDSEVLIHLYEDEGPALLEKLNGIFAFALWDEKQGSLLLARDRFGVKPLYYTESDGFIAFASEIKALLTLPGIRAELDFKSFLQFLQFLWIPGEGTAFKGIRKMLPGEYMVVSSKGLTGSRFFSLEYPAKGLRTGQKGEAYAAVVAARLEKAVKRQLVSDVPLGLFLSGGLDSSAVLSMMQGYESGKTKSFSAGFSERDASYETPVNDLYYARKMARLYDTEHMEFVLSPDLGALLPKIIWHLEDLLADPATIPTYLICENAAGSAKVLLSGQGGDEVFAGYPWHLAMEMSSYYQWLPRWLRGDVLEPLAGRVKGAKRGSLTQMKRRFKRFVRNGSLPFEERLIGFESYFRKPELEKLLSADFYAEVRHVDPACFHRELLLQSRVYAPLDRQLYMDMNTFLPYMNLTYTDKLSMAHSVEVRVPFLDNELVAYSTTIPPALKIKGTQTKYILKKALEKRLPKEIVYRKKAGFSSPLRSWLKGEMKVLVNDLLTESRIRSQGIFQVSAVNKLLSDFYSGLEDNSQKIFALMNFQMWSQLFLEGTISIKGK